MNVLQERDRRDAAHRAIVEVVMNRIRRGSGRLVAGLEAYQGATKRANSTGSKPLPEADADDRTSNFGNVRRRHDALDSIWEDMFGKLVEYKKKHGTCLVPNRYAADRQLGSWVSTQRRKYKDNSLSRERQERLNELGFAWATKNPLRVPWMIRYQQLSEFFEKHGHSKVPMNYRDKSLANWVSAQRQDRKNDSLSQERIDLLNRVEFVWDGLRNSPSRRQNRSSESSDCGARNDLATVSLSSLGSRTSQAKSSRASPSGTGTETSSDSNNGDEGETMISSSLENQNMEEV
jgi:hypothetical protein